MEEDKFKAFWIGERSEIYIGRTAKEISDYYDCEVMQESVKDGDFGEIENTQLKVFDEDGVKFETLQEIIGSCSEICQIGSSY